MAISISDTDHGFAELKATFAQIGHVLRVGVHSGRGGEKKRESTPEGERTASDGTRLIDVAVAHEFGLGSLPERSYLRAWADMKRGEILLDFTKLGIAVSKGAGPSKVNRWLGAMGIKYAGQIQARIAEGIEPPIAQSTADRKTKGSSPGDHTPLIDTGQLRSAIVSSVERAKGGRAKP